jgi:hypothetical protein
LIARPLTTYASLEHQEVHPWQVVGLHSPSSFAGGVWATAKDLSCGCITVAIAAATPDATVAFTKCLRVNLFLIFSVILSLLKLVNQFNFSRYFYF